MIPTRASILLTLAFQANCGSEIELSSTLGAISNGNEDTTNAYAAVVRLTRSIGTGVSTCSGTLITATHVLTAHHCFCEVDHTCAPPAEIQIAFTNGLGETDYVTHPIAILAAPSYVEQNGAVKSGDLAVLVLSSPAPVAPIGITFESLHVQQAVTLVGFGGTSEDDCPQSPLPDDRRVGEGVVDQFVSSDLAFVASSAGHDYLLLKGDSGGPLLGRRAGKLSVFGVASGTQCSSRKSVYQQLPAHEAWIRCAMTEPAGEPCVSPNEACTPRGTIVCSESGTVLCSDGSFDIRPETHELCGDGIDNDCNGCDDAHDADCGWCDSACGQTTPCGQPCPPCPQVDNCTDGIQDQGEQGIDCGGPCRSCITVSTSVQITPPSPRVDDTLSGNFALNNAGSQPVSFGSIVLGGRGPGGESDIRDFTHALDVTIPAGGTYAYSGMMTPSVPGTYRFFAAYEINGAWTHPPPNAGVVAERQVVVAANCTRTCAPNSCGVPDGCGGTCGPCSSGATCDAASHTCVSVGQDQCTSGVCCNTTTRRFASQGVPCSEEQYESFCLDDCGGSLRRSVARGFCTGTSATDCPVEHLRDEQVDNCGCGERCDASAATCVADGSCGTGAFPTWLPDGTLIQSSPDSAIWLIQEGKRRHVVLNQSTTFGEGTPLPDGRDVSSWLFNNLGWFLRVSPESASSFEDARASDGTILVESGFAQSWFMFFKCTSSVTVGQFDASLDCVSGAHYIVWYGFGQPSNVRHKVKLTDDQLAVMLRSWTASVVTPATSPSPYFAVAAGEKPLLHPGTLFQWNNAYYVAGQRWEVYKLALTKAELEQIGYEPDFDLVSIAPLAPTDFGTIVATKTLADFGTPCSSEPVDPYPDLGDECYSGPQGTENFWPCQTGSVDYDTGGLRYCRDEVVPVSEVCDDSVDNDCDGRVDAADTPECTPAGPPDADGDGFDALSDCNDQVFAIHPGAVELCNQVDDDCDSETDETHQAVGTPCDGDDLDSCKNGTYTCHPDGTAISCVNETASYTEVCDGADNDCDGQTDEGLRNACGTCGAVPSEACGNNLDDDCDGQTDEGCGPCAVDNAECDDGVVCTTNDRCSNGTCAGTPDHGRCAPSNQCMTATCSTSGCSETPRAGVCDDGNACTTNDACSGGQCVGTVGACSAGAIETTACGACGEGTKTRTCTSTCSWGAWSPCVNTGCAPGGTEPCSNEFGTGERTCTGFCQWSACDAGPAIYFTPDKTSVAFRLDDLELNDGTSIAELEAAGILCSEWFALGEPFQHEEVLNDANHDGVVEVEIPLLRHGDAPYAGCCPGGLPARFNLKECGWGSEESRWLHLIPDDPRFNDFVMLGTDTRCICTASLAVSRDASTGVWASGSELSYQCTPHSELCGPDYPLHEVKVTFSSGASSQGVAMGDLCSGPLQSWTEEPYSGSYSRTCTEVIPGLHRFQVKLTDLGEDVWAASEPVAGRPRAYYGTPTVTVDGVPVPVVLAHDWRMEWGANFFVCIGPDPCEFCCDGIDNDLDGDLDADDGDCWDISWCPPSVGTCGDDTCDATENCASCPADCGACPAYCGPPSGGCNPFETHVTGGTGSGYITWYDRFGQPLVSYPLPVSGGTYSSPEGACSVSVPEGRTGDCFLCTLGRAQEFCDLPVDGYGCAHNGDCAQ